MGIEHGVWQTTDDALEFRSTTDDAWRPVHLDVVVSKLIVTYVDVNATKKQDLFGADDFNTLAEVQNFRSRFRPYSEQVRDEDCYDINVGVKVCVLKSFSDDDHRLYDGFVDEVRRVDHIATGTDDEECLCEFMIFWRHGPLSGTLSLEKLENIHLLVPGVGNHNALKAFIHSAQQRFPEPKKRKESPTRRMSPPNDRESIALPEPLPSTARNGDPIFKLLSNLANMDVMHLNEGTKKPLGLPGLETKHEITIDFRSFRDDAWHEVKLCMNAKGELGVIYNDFAMFGLKEYFKVDAFNTLGEIVDFRERFRPSPQLLRPGDCHEVKVGDLVCVPCDFEGEDKSGFYDAVVNEVIRYEHAFLDSQGETCFCSFEVFWKHGPKGGTVSTTPRHHICRTLRSNEIHPSLASFLDTARLELGWKSRRRAMIDEQHTDIPQGSQAEVTLSSGEPSARDKGKKIMIE